MSRLSLGPLLLAVIVGASTHPALSAPPPSPAAAHASKDAGSVEGEVVSVDFRNSRFSVRSGGIVYDVVILPSTDFEGRNNSFRGITDIKKGAHVNVMLSQRAETFTAQIIHLH